MIDVQIDDSGFTFALNGLSKNAGNTIPLMRSLAGDLQDAVEETFEKEGRPGKWEGLAESTIESREKRGKWPGKILQVSGRLANSISQRYNAREAVVGTNLPYARIHQKGGQAGRGGRTRIPARPYMTVTDRDMDEMKLSVMEHLVKGIA